MKPIAPEAHDRGLAAAIEAMLAWPWFADRWNHYERELDCGTLTVPPEPFEAAIKAYHQAVAARPPRPAPPSPGPRYCACGQPITKKPGPGRYASRCTDCRAPRQEA